MLYRYIDFDDSDGVDNGGVLNVDSNDNNVGGKEDDVDTHNGENAEMMMMMMMMG